MIKKSIVIDGQEVTFAASAALPRLYRHLYNRDLFKDLKQLSENVEASNEAESTLNVDSLTMFENISYAMAKHARADIPNIDEWLEGFSMFSIYQVFPEILKLWSDNLEQQATAKKNLVALTVK